MEQPESAGARERFFPITRRVYVHRKTAAEMPYVKLDGDSDARGRRKA